MQFKYINNNENHWFILLCNYIGCLVGDTFKTVFQTCSGSVLLFYVIFDSSSLAAISPQSLPVLSQYKTCPQHHALVLSLSSVLQTIAICCPGALIWNSNPSGGSSSSTASSGNNSSGANADAGNSKPTVLGSPLDRLPIAPSAMPLPSPGNAQGSLNSEVAKFLNVMYLFLLLSKPLSSLNWLVVS